MIPLLKIITRKVPTYFFCCISHRIVLIAAIKGTCFRQQNAKAKYKNDISNILQYK